MIRMEACVYIDMIIDWYYAIRQMQNGNVARPNVIDRGCYFIFAFDFGRALSLFAVRMLISAFSR